jgi:hypothetical protein
MRIEIKYRTSTGPHLIDLSLEDLDQLRWAMDISIEQAQPASKSLYIDGSADELEVLASALLNRAVALRRPRRD